MPTNKNKSSTLITPTGLGRRKVLAAAGGAAAALPLLGRRALAADTIPIGWVGPLSPPGGYAEGANMKVAAEMAAAEINAQGGLLGRQVEMFYADTRGMPAEGRTGIERLITQNKVEDLQTQTIALQDAEKALENSMAGGLLDDITGWVQDQEDLYGGYYQELWQVKSALTK